MRLLAYAELPVSARAWGDLELVVRDGNAELLRKSLSRDTPNATIDVVVPGTDLVIELEEAGNGPVQDTVVLHWPLLLSNRRD